MKKAVLLEIIISSVTNLINTEFVSLEDIQSI